MYFVFFLSGGTGGETLHRCVGDMWNFTSCFARRSSGLFLTQKENRGQRGHLVVCFYSFIYFPNASDDI